MMRHYAYTIVELNSPLQPKGNETMLTIKWTPLKTNTLTVTANKVDVTAASNTIALSKKKIKMQQTTRRDSNCNVKLPKLIN
jgi:hypothetical protein